jgi:AraC-like DNA-binding protein
MSSSERKDPVIEAIVEHVLVAQGDVVLDELIAQSGLARRQFERRFKHTTGFSPAFFQRLVRFQRSYRMLENGTATSLTDMAHTCGYFDQSHFIRDFKRFSGMNPRTYFMKAQEKVDNFVRMP